MNLRVNKLFFVILALLLLVACGGLVEWRFWLCVFFRCGVLDALGDEDVWRDGLVSLGFVVCFVVLG